MVIRKSAERCHVGTFRNGPHSAHGRRAQVALGSSTFRGMRTRIALLVGIVGLAFGSGRATAQLSSAELFVNIDAGVSATDEGNPTESDSFSDGPRNANIFLNSGNIPWSLFVSAGGGTAESNGSLTYLATNTSQIYSRGDFDFEALASTPAAALASFDAVMGINFQVATQRTLTISGFVSTLFDLEGPEVVNCQYNGVILAGDDRFSTLPGGTYFFDVERTLFPGETGALGCSAASSGADAESNTLVWDVTVTGLPEPGPALGSLVAVVSLALRRRCRSRSVAIARKPNARPADSMRE